jgi:protein ImuA
VKGFDGDGLRTYKERPMLDPATPLPVCPEGAAAPHDRRAALAGLRAQIGAVQARGAPEQSRLSLGDPTLDALLPGGGLAFGGLHAAHPETPGDQPAAAGLVLGVAAQALAVRAGALIWVRARAAFDFGAPYAPGLASFGLDCARVVLVGARTLAEALWATEEALRSAGAAAVLLEPGRTIAPTPARRLHLAAQAGGAIGLVLGPCGAGSGLASAARTCWAVRAMPSAAPAWAQGAGLAGIRMPPGATCFGAAVRGLDGRVRNFQMEWRNETGGFHSLAGLADRALAPASGRRAAGGGGLRAD